MDKKFFVILLCLVLFLSACKKEQNTSSETNTEQQGEKENSLNDFFSKLSPTLEYKVTYDVKSTTGTKITSMIQTMAVKGTNSVVSIGSKSSTTSVYNLDGKAYTCTISGTNKMCFETPETANPDTSVEKTTDLRENWQSYNPVSKGVRTIAGKPAYCFSYEINGATSESCLSQEGITVYMKFTSSKVESEYMATEYSSSVSDSEFELPVEPTILPSYN